MLALFYHFGALFFTLENTYEPLIHLFFGHHYALDWFNHWNSYKNYKQDLIHSFFKIKPYKLQDLEIGYKREMQNFNADLIDKQIVSENYYLNYNLSTNKKLVGLLNITIPLNQITM